MADGQYRQLTCVGCSVGFTSLARSGPRPDYCGKACRDRMRLVRKKMERKCKPLHELSCVGCSAAFTFHRKKAFCSRVCAQAANRRSRGIRDRDDWNAAKRAASQWIFKCEHCGVSAHRVPSSTNKQHVKFNRWCSQACRSDAAQLRRSEKVQARAEARRLISLKREAQAAAARALKAVRVVLKTCTTCGSSFQARNGNQKLCGLGCKKKGNTSETSRMTKRIWRKVYKMRKRCATVEVFSDLEILDRDGWVCQICGVKTPQRLRGTYKPNAPEVDHIVAISNGGSHSRTNVQCACRACNSKKRDGPPVGQLGLFAAISPPGGGRKFFSFAGFP